MRPITPILLFLTATFLSAVYCSCKKAEDKTIPLSAAVKGGYDFRPGTYWVFKDSLSNRYDSLVVTSNADFFSGGNVKYERVEMYISIYATGAGSSDTFNKLLLILDKADQVQLLYVVSGGDSFKAYNYAPVTYPFTAGSYHNAVAPTDTVSISQVPVLTLNGITFTNTTALSFQNSYTRSGSSWQFRDAFYLNETEGILKISLKHIPEAVYEEWNLARWHLVR